MPLHAKKQELKELLHQKLMERGWVGEPAPAEGAEHGEPAGISAPLFSTDLQAKPRMNAEDLRLTLHIKEVEVSNQELEVEVIFHTVILTWTPRKF